MSINNDRFNDDGASEPFVELPVPVAYLSWTRGDAKLRPLIESDPGSFFGGWRAFVVNKDNEPLPELPLPVVERTSEDGGHLYKVYATNVLHFIPLHTRTRFELRQKVTDEQTGREYQKVIASSKSKQPGYAPLRQVFGVVFHPEKDEYMPAVLLINKWSSFIAFEKAAQVWKKAPRKDGFALVRRYGSVGKIDKASGTVVPNFEVYGRGRSTPIEAVDVAYPRYFQVTQELNDLYEQSTAWKTCERWNVNGTIEEPVENSDMQKFLARCEELYLTNVEVEQIIKEHKGNYIAALKAIEEGIELSDMNE